MSSSNFFVIFLRIFSIGHRELWWSHQILLIFELLYKLTARIGLRIVFDTIYNCTWHFATMVILLPFCSRYISFVIFCRNRQFWTGKHAVSRPTAHHILATIFCLWQTLKMLNPRNGKKLELFKTSAQLVTNMAPDSTNPPTSYTPLWWSHCHPSWNPYSPDVEQNKKIFRVYVDSSL